MNQRIEQQDVSTYGRPDRDEIIAKDEIISLIIDLETMSADDFYTTYFSSGRKRVR